MCKQETALVCVVVGSNCSLLQNIIYIRSAKLIYFCFARYFFPYLFHLNFIELVCARVSCSNHIIGEVEVTATEKSELSSFSFRLIIIHCFSWNIQHSTT